MMWVLISVISAAVVYVIVTAVGIYKEMKDFDIMWRYNHKDDEDE